MDKPNPIQKLTMKLGAICEGEEPAVVLSSLTAMFACLTASLDEENFDRAVSFFTESVPSVRQELLKADKEETKQ